MVSIAVYSAAGVVAYVVWRLLRGYLVRSPLDNVPGPPPTSRIAGDMFQLLGQEHWDFTRNICDAYGAVAKLHGPLGDTFIHVYDPKALHSIFVKDQESYYKGPEAVAAMELLIGPGLLATYGVPHKKQRKMLNPVFSVAHMRNLTPLFYSISDQLRIAIETRIKDGPQTLDVLAWMGRTALELIGQGGLGHSFDPLVEDSRDEFAEAVKAYVPSFNEVLWAMPFFPYVKYMGPAWFRSMLAKIFPIKSVRRMKRVNDIVMRNSQKLLDAKKAAVVRGDQELMHMVAEGKDIMSILLRANMDAAEEDKLPDEELLAQMSTFIIAGVDTTSNAMSRILHLLSEHKDVQDRLRKEILDAREQYGDQIPYDELSQLPYLDAICRETLRLYAPLTLTNRQALHDTVLPLSEPIRGVDGTTMTEIPIPKGTFFWNNLRACNTNKALWGEDALEWKPERWLKPLPQALEDAHIPGIYSHLMTFISGGHACIGFKFSQLEMKVVISTLVAAFEFELSEKPIFWKFSGITYPVVSAESVKPEMYLKVSLA